MYRPVLLDVGPGSTAEHTITTALPGVKQNAYPYYSVIEAEYVNSTRTDLPCGVVMLAGRLLEFVDAQPRFLKVRSLRGSRHRRRRRTESNRRGSVADSPSRRSTSRSRCRPSPPLCLRLFGWRPQTPRNLCAERRRRSVLQQVGDSGRGPAGHIVSVTTCMFQALGEISLLYLQPTARCRRARSSSLDKGLNGCSSKVNRRLKSAQSHLVG